ncbi:CvfB family protein [Amphibacillus sediminis]|uniref:CvfB family protein n=1 Tax=Amphibacillus sediminis TaxID=360185 RepID=UPI00082C2ACD|nr:S1-like domain-containing RNA-binding protein [Amphibacillus sediminis]
MNILKSGEIVTLTVQRIIETGYVLTDGTNEILLHENETTSPLTEGEQVEAFLYHDKNNQLIATTILPSVRLDTFDWAEVVAIREGVGVFVDIGIAKHILVSEDDLPSIRTVWPKEGDQLYLSLKHDKKGRLLGEPVTEQDFEGNWDHANENMFNQDISGRVFRTGKEGAVIITEQGYRGFIHHSERKDDLRLGEWVQGRVIKVKHDGTLNISLLPRKQDARDTDAETIYQYLIAHNGTMPLDIKSSPELIQSTFNISKAAFKRAMGKLYKEGKIKQEDGLTLLIEKRR